MYLKSLELHGFKSFPNRTTLTFERGATVIVGPNGSGKSNISDAMRWVLGEINSRNIRGNTKEDVIFGGTDDRRPMGFAEVSVTFDNSDHENRLDNDADEVVVTRRIYRGGDSEYLINREKKRLKDIVELFMNTGVGREGYSIIGQGKVAEIVSKKSDERRNIFEEAAGIAKYRKRKEESERKLTQTQDNLDRLNDIKTMLEDRLGPLSRDAEKAKQGLELYEQKKRADVSLWLYDTKQIRDDIEKADNALKLSRHELEIVETTINDLNAENDVLYLKSQQNKLETTKIYEKIREIDEKMHQLSRAVELAESQVSHSAELIFECEKRIHEIEHSEGNVNKSKDEYIASRNALVEKDNEFLDKRLELLTEVQSLTAEVEKIKKELTEALDELTVEENLSTDLKVRIDVLKNSKVQDGTKTQDLEAEIEKYESEGVELKAEADRCEENAAEHKANIAAKEAIIEEKSALYDGLTEEKAQITEALNSLKLQHDELVQRADVLQRMNDHFEGYGESIKFVMREYNEGRLRCDGKIYGPLSTLISVEKEYITAIDTALGGSLQNIVVEDEATAKAAIYALKNASAGRATFYPISAIRAASETEEIKRSKSFDGFVGRADTLVSTKDKYRSVIEFLLLRTVVFDNIDNASVAAKKLSYKVKIVTLDGQVINTGGSFTGGSAKRDSGLLTRATEIANLREKAGKLDKRIEESESAILEITAEAKEAYDILKTTEAERDILLALARTQFAALDNANARYSANRNIIEKLRYDYNNLIGQQSLAEQEIKNLEIDYNSASERIEALKSFRMKRSEVMGELDDKADSLSLKANDLYTKSVEAKKEIEGVDRMIANIDERLSELFLDKQAQLARIDEINAKKEGLDETKAQNKVECDALTNELEALKLARRDAELGGEEFDRLSLELRRKLNEKNASQRVCYEAAMRDENKLNLLRERQEKLGAQLFDDYGLSYEDAVALEYPQVTAENRDEVAAIQTSARHALKKIGNFNPDSVEEYSKVKSEYDTLTEQFNDLIKSRDDLVNIISRLEDEMRTSFTTSFEAINKNFGVTFKELFGGGNAELILTEPEDVLTSGIEIKAAPPGKIIKSLSLLSGGEQSFVAIALLFAILKVNPTPFCILDEIEAALDEVNVFRFGEYVKRLADDTQFILITHRRGTMEVGNRLYGVTMPQRGISQAIELDVSEIEARQKELLDGVL